MVINEKILVRQLKAAYKSGGYIVINRPGGRTVFWTPAWTVEINAENLPREALALLALHMGCLPEEGRSYRIMKGKDEPTVQTMLFESAIIPIRNLETAVQMAAEVVPVKARKTVLTFDGYNLWQKIGNNGCLLVDPTHEELIRKRDDVVVVGDYLYKEGEISKVYIMRGNEPRYENQLNHLGQIPWIEK